MELYANQADHLNPMGTVKQFLATHPDEKEVWIPADLMVDDVIRWLERMGVKNPLDRQSNKPHKIYGWHLPYHGYAITINDKMKPKPRDPDPPQYWVDFYVDEYQSALVEFNLVKDQNASSKVYQAAFLKLKQAEKQLSS